MGTQPDRSGGSAPASRARLTCRRRLLVGLGVMAGLGWLAACATAPPPTVGGAAAARGGPVRVIATIREHGPWMDERAAEGVRLLEAGRAETAPAVQLPSPEAATLTAPLRGTLAPTTVGRTDATEDAIVSIFSGNPGALLAFAAVAERRHDWERAMRLYESVPDNEPQRTASLLRAKLGWRRSNLPRCAQQAIASTRLTRSELAILVVSMAPQLEMTRGASSPVLSDIIDLPCYGDVVTAARLGLLDVDRLEHRFFPARAARPEEVRGAVAGLCHLLDIVVPVWCGDTGAPVGCTPLSLPVRGAQVAELVSRLTETEKP